jgi:nucleotide-binding universal stress UspA family protein
LPVDVGPGTRAAWGERIASSRTLLWHGPLGISEVPAFAVGTVSFAAQVTSRTWPLLHRSIVCGDRLVQAIRKCDLPFERIHLLSSAGQSILHYAAERPLPALEALKRPHLPKQKHPVVVLALTGAEDDVPLARFAAAWLPDTATIHSVYVESGLDEDRYPDIYRGRTKAERLAEQIRAEEVFARGDAALAGNGMTSSTHVFVHGPPPEKLVQRARKLEADLILLGKADAPRKRYPTEKVIDAAPCDVVIFAEGLAAIKPASATRRLHGTSLKWTSP